MYFLTQSANSAMFQRTNFITTVFDLCHRDSPEFPEVRSKGQFFARERHVRNNVDEAEDNANNMRLYEATGIGAMLLTGAKKNLRDLFEPGMEVATYSGPDDSVKQIRYFLDNERERAAIAAAGQQRTLGSHTYRHRMQELVDLLAPLVRKA